MRMRAWMVGALLLTSTISAQAAVLCEKKSGALFVRSACLKKEKVVDPTALGLQGPKGDPGLPGPKGELGATGPSGPPGSNATINGVSAGGSLAGTYPNPTIASGVITDANVQPNSLTGASINASTLSKVPSAANADNAAQLGGVAASSIYQPCASDAIEGQDGTIKGAAVIDGAAATSSLSTTGVTSGFVCTGQHVQVLRLSTGSYEVTFGNVSHNSIIGIPSYASRDLVVVTPQSSGVIARALGAFQCAFSPPPYVICFQVELTDLSGNPVDGTFSIAML